MKEFIVNEYIRLKLENQEIHIYVNNELFRQCRYLLLNIPKEYFEYKNTINSVDDAESIMNRSLEEGSIFEFKITPSQEFWAHCSNIQAWSENNYDTRLLHRSIAFPLLRKLYELGDPTAKRVFKEEIVKRYESGNESVREFLLNERYIQKYVYQEFLDYFLNHKTLNILDYISQQIGKTYQIKNSIHFFSEINSPQFSLVLEKSGLVDLDLSLNDLETLPESIFDLKSLKGLYLRKTLSKKISRNIGNLRYLERLNLSENLLESLPFSVKSLEHLECLDLDSNHLNNIPECIFHLKNLRYLNLGFNNISTLPESIGNLESLEDLILSYNLLKEIPESIKNLKHLRRLSLRYNNLSRLPKCLLEIKSLKEIYLERNFKGTIPWSNLRHLVKRV